MKYSVKISRITLAFLGVFLPTCDTIEEEKTPREVSFSDLQLPCTSSPCEFRESIKTRGSVVVFTWWLSKKIMQNYCTCCDGAGFLWTQIQGLLKTAPFISYNTKKILWHSSRSAMMVVVNAFFWCLEISSCRSWLRKHHLPQIDMVFWCTLKVKGWEPECSNSYLRLFFASQSYSKHQSHSFVYYYQYPH